MNSRTPVLHFMYMFIASRLSLTLSMMEGTRESGEDCGGGGGRARGVV